MDSGRARTPDEGPAARRPFGKSDPQTPHPPSSPTSDSVPQQGEEEKKFEADVTELVASLERERDEYLELARRTKADFENYRKRIDREAREAEVRGRAGLARDLLSVVDNLERALAAAEPPEGQADNHIAEGVRLVYEELAGVLKNAGIESFSPTGERFDPDEHEAMLARPGNEGEVLEVFQKGYRLNGQVLRPARVVVGSADHENQPSGGKPPAG